MTFFYTEIQVGEIAFIQRTNDDGSISTIPTNPANSDYQAYLATLASELSNPSTPQAGA
jgi:hypothetical protein